MIVGKNQAPAWHNEREPASKLIQHQYAAGHGEQTGTEHWRNYAAKLRMSTHARLYKLLMVLGMLPLSWLLLRSSALSIKGQPTSTSIPVTESVRPSSHQSVIEKTIAPLPLTDAAPKLEPNYDFEKTAITK